MTAIRVATIEKLIEGSTIFLRQFRPLHHKTSSTAFVKPTPSPPGSYALEIIDDIVEYRNERDEVIQHETISISRTKQDNRTRFPAAAVEASQPHRRRRRSYTSLENVNMNRLTRWQLTDQLRRIFGGAGAKTICTNYSNGTNGPPQRAIS
ncbi:uncharacterized protein LOC118646091 [Monomorium pharaonis]|uniref:uncharacterized protein LOC118646091 n=1 Tax=Monomorium pharaonis TaxID=307658 RepID=UPI0017468357|nr:uncharacterized protein LOC118646091 [Monomorium pharaonis]